MKVSTKRRLDPRNTIFPLNLTIIYSDEIANKNGVERFHYDDFGSFVTFK